MLGPTNPSLQLITTIDVKSSSKVRDHQSFGIYKSRDRSDNIFINGKPILVVTQDQLDKDATAKKAYQQQLDAGVDEYGARLAASEFFNFYTDTTHPYSQAINLFINEVILRIANVYRGTTHPRGGRMDFYYIDVSNRSPSLRDDGPNVIAIGHPGNPPKRHILPSNEYCHLVDWLDLFESLDKDAGPCACCVRRDNESILTWDSVDERTEADY